MTTNDKTTKEKRILQFWILSKSCKEKVATNNSEFKAIQTKIHLYL